MEPVRLGLIGYGVIGRAHYKTATEHADNVQVVAVADLLDDKRAEAREAGAAKVYRNDDELVADPDVEAVTVAAPTGVRDAIVMKALKLGKHVLFEKPPALNAAAVERFIALRGDRVAACCSARVTFQDSADAVRRFVASGKLGPLRVVRIQIAKPAGGRPKNPPPPWRQSFALNGGGILVNWGIYDLHYMMTLTDWQLRPVSVFAQSWPVAEVFEDRVAGCSDADSHFAAIVRCAGGQIIAFERGEFMAAAAQQQWQIVGANGTVTTTMVDGKDKTVRYDRADGEQGVVSETLWQGDDRTNGTAAQYVDFAEAVRDGHTPRGNLEQCLLMQRIFDGIYASARAGRSVEIDSLP